MNSKRLASIAFIGKVLAKHNQNNNVYSYDSSEYYNYSLSSNGGTITIYDYNRSCYLSGTRNGDRYTFFDYEISNYFTVDVGTTPYKVYDYATSSFYNIYTQTGLSIYSFPESKYYQFT